MFTRLNWIQTSGSDFNKLNMMLLTQNDVSVFAIRTNKQYTRRLNKVKLLKAFLFTQFCKNKNKNCKKKTFRIYGHFFDCENNKLLNIRVKQQEVFCKKPKTRRKFKAFYFHSLYIKAFIRSFYYFFYFFCLFVFGLFYSKWKKGKKYNYNYNSTYTVYTR